MQIAISVLTSNRPELLRELSEAVNNCRCNITECRVTTLASEMVIAMLINGNWNHVAKLENVLDALAGRLELTINYQRTETPRPSNNHLPYSIDACGQDREGIILELTDFLDQRNIIIQELAGGNQPAAFSQLNLFSVHLSVLVPSGLPLISLRDEFLEFCDRLNIDAMIDPIKR